MQFIHEVSKNNKLPFNNVLLLTNGNIKTMIKYGQRKEKTLKTSTNHAYLICSPEDYLADDLNNLKYVFEKQ